MDDDAGRLVDDDQVVVLVEDVERDVLALRRGGFRLGHVDGDLVAGRELALGLVDDLAADADGALLDQRLDAAARQVGREAGGQPLVEPLACGIGVGLEHYQSASLFAI